MTAAAAAAPPRGDIVVLGTSAGGPDALRRLVAGLPRDRPAAQRDAAMRQAKAEVLRRLVERDWLRPDPDEEGAGPAAPGGGAGAA